MVMSRSANVAKCADACGSVAAVGGCCLESRCPELCKKIKRSFIKALPSEVNNWDNTTLEGGRVRVDLSSFELCIVGILR